MEKEKKLKAERAMKSAALAEEGRKRAADRVKEKKKREVQLGEDDANNLQTLYDHYKSGTFFKRADWLNCTQTLGLLDGTLVTKKDLENFYGHVLPIGDQAITFQSFCSAMGMIAQRTHPGEEGNEKDNNPSKCLERLLFDLMGDPSHEEVV